jgi:putative ABC transport system permease protein
VRFALGASAREVRRLVLSETLRLSMPGVLLGSAAALAAGLAVGSRITGISISPGPFALAIALQATVTLLAAWSPARRAATANPLDVLRSE